MILAHPGQTISEELVVHELYHLKMRIDGFPTVYFRGVPAIVNDQYLTNDLVELRIFDPIEHRMFYPKLREMGYSPEADRKAEMRRIISDGGYSERSLSDTELAIRMFEAVVEVEDADALAGFFSLYEKKGWTTAMRLGRKAAEIVLASTPDTPEKEVSTFIACANALLGSSSLYRTPLSFELIQLETERWGQVDRKFALVRIKAAS